MRIAVLGGGGAMGGLFGGWLARSGQDVVLIDVSAPTIEAINRDGLTIEERDGSVTTVRVPATDRPETVGPADLILTFVKCYHTEAAIRAAAPMIGEWTIILSLQNGWGNADRIAAIAGRERVLVGLTYHSCGLAAPGRVRHPGSGMTFLGEPDGPISARVETVAAALAEAGFAVTASARILDEIWKKLALNVCTLPTAALLGFTADALNRHAGTRTVMRALLAEVGAVARARGIALDEAERWEAITTLLDRAVGAKGSMVQDLEARRPTEIDVICGAIVAAGRAHDVPTPINETMAAMVTSLQESYLAARVSGPG